MIAINRTSPTDTSDAHDLLTAQTLKPSFSAAIRNPLGVSFEFPMLSRGRLEKGAAVH